MLLKSRLHIRVLNCLRLAAELSLLGILLQSLAPRYQTECFLCVTVLKLAQCLFSHWATYGNTNPNSLLYYSVWWYM